MSFELTLTSKHGPLDAAAFEALFTRRPYYQLGEDQAAYQNDDTGVYFLLDLADGAVRFSINTRRPEIFAEEAAEELAALSGEAFDADAFLADWRAANAKAIAAMLAEGKTPLTLPLATNRDVWRWNRELRALQKDLGEVEEAPPLVFFMGPGGNPRPAYVWLVTRPTVKPPLAEVVLLADDPPVRLRDKLLGAPSEPVTIGLIDIRWLRDLRFPMWQTQRELPISHVPGGKRVPGLLATMAGAHGYARPAGARIKTDQILDRETVEAARATLD